MCLIFGHKQPKVVKVPGTDLLNNNVAGAVIFNSTYNEVQLRIQSDKHGMTVNSQLCDRCGLYWKVEKHVGPAGLEGAANAAAKQEYLEQRRKQLLETNNDFIMTYLRLMNLSDEDKEMVIQIMKDELERNGRRS